MPSDLLDYLSAGDDFPFRGTALTSFVTAVALGKTNWMTSHSCIYYPVVSLVSPIEIRAEICPDGFEPDVNTDICVFEIMSNGLADG